MKILQKNCILEILLLHVEASEITPFFYNIFSVGGISPLFPWLWLANGTFLLKLEYTHNSCSCLFSNSSISNAQLDNYEPQKAKLFFEFAFVPWENGTAYGQGRSQGGKGGKFPPPETEKLFRKNAVISEGSIFSNKFSKNKKSIFVQNLHQKIAKFSQNFPTMCVFFFPNGQKMNTFEHI